MSSTSRSIGTVTTWNIGKTTLVVVSKEGRVINTRETRTMGLLLSNLSKRSRILRRMMIILTIVTTEGGRICRGRRPSLRARI